MVKKSSTKKPKINYIWFAFALLLCTQIVTIGYLIKIRMDADAEGPLLMNRLINEVELKRYSEPVISVNENRVYVPESKIFMPLNDVSRNLRYYSTTWPGLRTDLYLSTKEAVGYQSSADDPSCDRMVRISTMKETFTNEKFVGEIMPTKDGLRYVYQNVSKCSIYPVETSDKLVEIAKSIQQY